MSKFLLSRLLNIILYLCNLLLFNTQFINDRFTGVNKYFNTIAYNYVNIQKQHNT